METARPLAYDSLRTVLQYIEPNLRFKLAQRVPSIALTEKAVPLKIDKLEFHPYEFIVNDTLYSLGTYRCYPPGVEPLREHRDDNLQGGVAHDLDQYGFADYSSEVIITQGDVVIHDMMGGNREPYTDEHARRLESQLEVYKWILAGKMGHEVEPLDINHPDYFLIEGHERSGTEHLQQRIDRLETVLAPALCRRNGSRPVYTTMVQFSVKCPNKKTQFFRKQCNTKLYEFQKILVNRLFGNRKAVAFAKFFEIGFGGQASPQMVIRLPPGFQVKVQEMAVFDNAAAVCTAVESLIHSSSYPLKQFQVYNNNVHSSIHPTICNSQKLIFCDYSYFQGGITDLFPFVNQEIYIGRSRFTPDEHVTLLRHWIENSRHVGTCFVSKFGNENTVREIFSECKKELNGVDNGARSVKVPMSKTAMINLYYRFLKTKGARPARYMLTIKVVAV